MSLTEILTVVPKKRHRKYNEWLRKEQIALQVRRIENAKRESRERKIALLRKMAIQFRSLSGCLHNSSDNYWRMTNAAVSCALLAALAENHEAPPPDYEDGLSDCFSYAWVHQAQDYRFNQLSVVGSPASSVAELGGKQGAF